MGYVAGSSKTSLLRFSGLGSAGEEDKGSKAGSREVVGRFAAGDLEAAVSGRVVEGAMLSSRHQLPSTRVAEYGY